MGWFSGKGIASEYRLLNSPTPFGIVVWLKDTSKASDSKHVDQILSHILKTKTDLPRQFTRMCAMENVRSLTTIKPSTSGCELHIGLTGGTYTLADAWAALQKNDIAGGRHMLEIVCWQRKSDLESNALAVFELMREPMDNEGAATHHINIANHHAGSCEAKSLGAIIHGPLHARDTGTLTDGYNSLVEALREASLPLSCHGTCQR